MMQSVLVSLQCFALLFLGCSTGSGKPDFPSYQPQQKTNTMSNTMDTAILANGCFWCTEAIFQDLKGVEKVTSGYIGGHLPNPGYDAVCTGTTGHAEALQIVYDPSKISFEELLEIFWNTHDPTTLNRQGNDVGTQYRSGVFYTSDKQKDIACLLYTSPSPRD